MQDYSIGNIVNYRQLNWQHSDDFLYLQEIPGNFEPFRFFPDFFSFGIIENGDLAVDIDNYTYDVKDNAFIICRPNQTFKTVSVQPGTKGAFILFNKNFINCISEEMAVPVNNMFLNKGFGSYRDIYSSDHIKLSELFNGIFSLLSKVNKDRWEYTAKNLISALINETDVILSTYKSSEIVNSSPKEIELIGNFNDLVSKYFQSKRDIKFYSERLFVSSSLLYKTVRKHLEATPHEIINSALQKEAKYLLAHTNFTVTEIADKLSFSDIYSFSKYFKKQSGFSPIDYRSKLNNTKLDK